MKRFCLFIMICLCPMLLTSCYEPAVGNSVYYSGRGDLFVPFAYSMPVDAGYYSSHARKKLALQVLETDDYGRTLCSLSFHYYSNAFFGNGEAYCIVQKSSDSETSFYEDICCAGVRNAEDAEPVIEQLKHANDWNLPLDDTRMTTLPYQGLDPTGVYAITVKDDDYEEAALEFLDMDSYGCAFEIICKDAYGRTLISLDYEKKDEAYLVIMRDGEGLNGAASAHKVENMTSPWEEIHKLKQENGWNLP